MKKMIATLAFGVSIICVSAAYAQDKPIGPETIILPTQLYNQIYGYLNDTPLPASGTRPLLNMMDVCVQAQVPDAQGVTRSNGMCSAVADAISRASSQQADMASLRKKVDDLKQQLANSQAELKTERTTVENLSDAARRTNR